jgi:cytochrome c oxidase assembly factor CtaG
MEITEGQRYLESLVYIINIIGLFLWMYSILRITFSAKITPHNKLAYVLCGDILFLAALGVYVLVSPKIGLISAPIFFFSYFGYSIFKSTADK